MSNSDQSPDVLKALTKKRGSLKSKLTLFEKFIVTFESLNVEDVTRVKTIELEQRFNIVEGLIHTFDRVQDEIESVADNPEEHYIEREEFESKFHAILARSKIQLERFKSNNDDENSNASSACTSNSHCTPFKGVKLPEIELPKFNGNYELWMEFRDTFESLIHNNNQINHIQKFHYLRASLVGSAIQVIQSLEFTAKNYVVAWDTLCDRFNNKQLLIQNHLKAIFDMESIVSPSSAKIRYLYEHLFKHLCSLQQLGEPTDKWDTLIVYLIASKLDKTTSQEWEKLRANCESVTLFHFKDFLKKRANLLETIEMNFRSVNDKQNDAQGRKYYKPNSVLRGLAGQMEEGNNSSSYSDLKYTCFNCKGDHSLFYCSDFLKLSVQDRIKRVKYLHLCMNCLRRNHLPKDFKWTGCKTCGRKHNTVLHENRETENSAVSVDQDDQGPSNLNLENNDTVNITNTLLVSSRKAILATAKIQVGDKANTHFVTARALLDCGSQSSFITSELCKKLNINKVKTNLAVSGIGDTLSYAKYKCHINIKSLNSSYCFNLSCFVLDKITADVPNTHIDLENINIPGNITLADPEFFEPQSIDVLIGADAFWQLLSVGQIRLGSNALLLQNTRLGWVIAGNMVMPINRSQCNLNINHDTNISVQNQLSKFWEIEEIDVKNPWSVEEQACEDHFLNSLSTDESGRYIVSLPFKKSPSLLGDSRETAIKRFLSLERKLGSNEPFRRLYTDFLLEYERLGHMTEIPDNSDINNMEYFLPHHGVLKEGSSTTKLRVVFNASSPTSTGLSLNDLQMTGPTIQNDLFSIILRFRTRPIALSSDIEMMYRQVLISPEQRSLQKIVWRSNPNKPIKTYKLNTVTYGTTAASFLAIRCLHQAAFECEKEYPTIANIIRNDMYVDDLLTCTDTKEEANYIIENISGILLKHGFKLRKWKSNNKTIVFGSNKTDSSNVLDFSVNKEYECKTLGLSWHCERDILTYKIRQSNNSNTITKRSILSRIASIFDPLGLLGPSIIIAKVLLQKLWAENLTWDQPLPDRIINSWVQFSSELDNLNNVVIQRKTLCENPVHVSLHGFADASESSYGACIYVVSTNTKAKRTSSLLCAKSKVAPIKSLTMPRLELCAALLLSQLVSKVLNCLSIKIDNIYCWSDSTIVLGWLRISPSLLNSFVSNRVSAIQKLTNSFIWNHVSTLDNPADIISRGLSPNKLIASKLWFHGPTWLVSDSDTWPIIEIPCIALPEKQKTCLLTMHVPGMSFTLFERFSNLLKLKRVFAYALRFIKNSRLAPELRTFSSLSVHELNESLSYLIRIAQKESFNEDYTDLQQGKALSRTSKILSLNPFYDKSERILRVGGRLTNSDFPFSRKHPILLSAGHNLTKLIFEFEHLRLMHAGPQLLLSNVRDLFWPLLGRNLARKTVKNCVKCARYNGQKIQPIMGELPASRVRPTTPFSVIGVDYAGPFIMKDKRGRGCKPIKCWVSLFVCFSTRAIHLEIVLSLSCDDFLQGFNRFISRRGKPYEVFSDNVNQGIKWHFIPPNSPHFGGIWEAGVKSLKYHLRRIIGNSSIFFFDFQTLLTRIESILNSRPLFPLSSNPDDLTALTPAHFLIGRNSMSMLEPPVPEVNENRLSQYQLLQRLYEHFWKRWSREYINELQQRRRWKQTQGQLNVDQLVLVKDDNLPPAMWRLGRVVQLKSGKDGVSRVAIIKTADGTTSRAVIKLCPLPIAS